MTGPVAAVGWLEGLSPSARQALREAMPMRAFADGDVIYRQGEEGTTLFEIVSGHLLVVRLSADGVESVLGVLGPGECVGEQGLVAGGPRVTGARACGPVRVRVLTRAAYERLRRDHPGISDRLLGLVVQRLRQTVTLIAEQSQSPLRDRLLRRLLVLAQLSERPAGGDGMVDLRIHLRQSDLAGWVGASRQRLNMTLADLQRAGFVTRRKGGRLGVNSPAAARALAERAA